MYLKKNIYNNQSNFQIQKYLRNILNKEIFDKTYFINIKNEVMSDRLKERIEKLNQNDYFEQSYKTERPN